MLKPLLWKPDRTGRFGRFDREPWLCPVRSNIKFRKVQKTESMGHEPRKPWLNRRNRAKNRVYARKKRDERNAEEIKNLHQLFEDMESKINSPRRFLLKMLHSFTDRVVGKAEQEKGQRRYYVHRWRKKKNRQKRATATTILYVRVWRRVDIFCTDCGKW